MKNNLFWIKKNEERLEDGEAYQKRWIGEDLLDLGHGDEGEEAQLAHHQGGHQLSQTALQHQSCKRENNTCVIFLNFRGMKIFKNLSLHKYRYSNIPNL